jgi:hypothetical protein
MQHVCGLGRMLVCLCDWVCMCMCMCVCLCVFSCLCIEQEGGGAFGDVEGMLVNWTNEWPCETQQQSILFDVQHTMQLDSYCSGQDDQYTTAG